MADEDAGELEAPGDGHETKEIPSPGPVAEKDRRIEELTDDLKRLQAEFENYKKRIAKEGAERSRAGVEAVVRDLLAVLDTFDKALEDAGKNDYPGQLTKGLEGLHRQLLQTLQRHGLREVSATGLFDPFEHEAVMREETDDVDEGTILDVYQKGYALGPRVIRTSKVKVSRKTDKEEVHDTQESESEERGE